MPQGSEVEDGPGTQTGAPRHPGAPAEASPAPTPPAPQAAPAPPRVGLAAPLAVAVATALLFLVGLGQLDLWAPDEPRYAQVAEEIRSLERGPESLVLLSLNEQVYDQKPPLYYWLAALAGAPGDRVSELDARLPSALAGLATVALLLVWGPRLLGSRAGATLGAAFLASSWLFLHLARRAQLDVLLTLFETLALVAFWRLDRGIGSARANVLGLHAAMGLGVLTKGPVGFLVPALVIVAWLLWEGRPRALRRAFPAYGFALSVLPGVLWIALATWLAPGDFFQGAVVDNIYGRFFVGTSKVNPWHYFLYVFPASALPWALLWPLVWLAGRRRVFVAGAPDETKRAWRFLLAWVGVTFLFFSFSAGKRSLYLLTCFPAAALLTGDATVRMLAGRRALPRAAGLAAAAFVVLLGLAALVMAALPVVPNVDVAFTVPLALAAVGVVGAWLWPRTAGGMHGALGQIAVLAGGVMAIEMVVFALFLPALDPEKSPRPIARAAAALAPPGAPIGLVDEQPFIGGLVYYSGHPVRPLRSPDSIETFFSREQGRVAVLSTGALERVQETWPVEVRARFRTGEREMLVVVPRGAAPPVAAPEAGATAPAAPEGPPAAGGEAAVR